MEGSASAAAAAVPPSPPTPPADAAADDEVAADASAVEGEGKLCQQYPRLGPNFLPQCGFKLFHSSSGIKRIQ